MNDSTLQAQEFVKEALELTKHLHEMSGAKTGVLLIAAGILAATTQPSFEAFFPNPYAQLGLVLMLLSLGVSILTAIVSVFPRFGSHSETNLMYYVDIVTKYSNHVDYENELIERIDSGELLHLYTEELLAFGRGLLEEYKWQKISLLSLLGYIPAFTFLGIAAITNA